MVTSRTKAFIAAAGVIAASLGMAATAGADPDDDSCPLAVALICKFMPIAPGLDHDIDLTQGSGTLNGQSLPQMPKGAATSDEAPAPLCSNGCT